MVTLIYVTVDPVYEVNYGEEGRFERISGWSVQGTSQIERDGSIGTAYWQYCRKFRTQEDAESYGNIVVKNGLKVNENNWDLLNEDFRTLDDLEQEWNEYAIQERHQWY